MGGLAAILHRDGRPLDLIDLARVASRSAYRAVDGVSASIRGSVGLAHLQFSTTSGDPGQPLFDRARQLFFVFDGRLDNRPDLLATLNLPVSSSDGLVAMSAVGRWGDQAPAHLLGDFAFVAWNVSRRWLLCARDHMGARPLYYWASPRVLVCATDIAQVLAHPDVPCVPNPVVAADYLCVDVRNGPDTLYRDVMRLPPGHVLVADARGVRLSAYWSPEPGSPIRYRRDDEYASHCRDLLIRSVGDRMRSDRPMAAFLSGGLDSSAVVTVAHRLIARHRPPPQPFSLVFPDHPESDERAFIRAVADACGVAEVHVLPAPIAGAALTRRAETWMDVPGLPADEMMAAAFEAISDRGHRVVLTGAGGDFLFSGSPFQYADLLGARRPVAALRRFADDWRADDTGRSALGLVQAGLWPLLPHGLKAALRPLARRAYGVRSSPAWLRIAREPVRHPEAPRGGSYATEEVTRRLGSGLHAFFLESHERSAAERGVEIRNPLLDRRLVDFALNIPDDQRRRGPYTKYVLRNALEGHLAAAVLKRRTKADFSHGIADALEAVGGAAFFARLAIAEAGWVSPGPIVALYRAMRLARSGGPAAYGTHVPTLWMIAAVELWFRALSGRGCGPASGDPAIMAEPRAEVS